jgi:hypothetical protein
MTETTNGDEQEREVGPNPTWGSGIENFYQTGQVDTVGVGGGQAQSTVMSAHRAASLQAAVDELEGKAPRGSAQLAVGDVNLDNPDERAAYLTRLKEEQAIAADLAGQNDDDDDDSDGGDGGDPQAQTASRSASKSSAKSGTSTSSGGSSGSSSSSGSDRPV